MMRAFPRYLKAVLSLDGTLSSQEQQKRTLFFFINSVAMLFGFSLVGILSKTMHERSLNIIGCVLFLTASCTGVLSMLCRRRLSTLLVVTVACLYFVSILCFDVSKRSMGGTVWANIVLIVDFLLVMQTPQRYTIALVGITCLWLVLMYIEERVRFGVLDMPGLATQESRRAHFESLTECTELPCAHDKSRMLLTSLCLLLIDFIATRGFAHNVLKEQASMERTINAVQEIASLLAGYDVEKVAELLATHEHELPEGMTTALRSLEENLRVYKAYLPQTCLPFERRKATFSKVSLASSSDVGYSSTPTDSSLSTSVFQMTVQQQLKLSSVMATLLTLNIKDTLHRLEEDSARFSDLFTTLLLKTLQATEVRRGMVDVFVGDRIHCSFNASKSCASHATSALHTATLLLRDDDIAPHVNMGVATGKVLCGDMGCEVMRRFSMVGALVRDVNVLERAGRVLGYSALCNRLCFSDAECEHELRLVPCKVEVELSREEVVAELVVPKDAPNVPEAEWMYMIEGNKQWEEYNTAVRGYLKGEVSASAVAKAAQSKSNTKTVHNLGALPPQCEVLRLSVPTKDVAASVTSVLTEYC